MAEAPKRRLINHQALWTLVRDVFAAAGTSQEHAADVADVLTWANLRGVDSHGVVRVPRYVEMFASGEANAKPNMTVKALRPALALLDANAAPGPVALKRAMNEAIRMARNTGIAWVSVRGTVHTGAIGYYTEMAAKEGMIGIGMVAGIPNMGYHGAKGVGVATSPLSIAVPAGKHPQIVLDMATATIALGKIAQAKQRGEQLPEGAAVTEEGLPTTDPNLAAIPTPMSGAKGSGMSLTIELLTSVLAANAILTPFHGKTPEGRKHRQNAVMIAVDIAAFSELAAFTGGVDAAVDTIKGLPIADGAKEILFPGERGARTLQQRQRDGIPVAPRAWAELEQAAKALGVTVPAE